jgi:hypothetical protein
MGEEEEEPWRRFLARGEVDGRRRRGAGRGVGRGRGACAGAPSGGGAAKEERTRGALTSGSRRSVRDRGDGGAANGPLVGQFGRQGLGLGFLFFSFTFLFFST